MPTPEQVRDVLLFLLGAGDAMPVPAPLEHLPGGPPPSDLPALPPGVDAPFHWPEGGTPPFSLPQPSLPGAAPLSRNSTWGGGVAPLLMIHTDLWDLDRFLDGLPPCED